MFRTFWLTSVPAVVLAGLATGCGGAGEAPGSLSLNPVKGKVLLADGKPLAAGRVVLVSPTTGLAPNGKIGPDGSFTLTSGDQGEGAPAGEYKVRIEPDAAMGAGGSQPRSGSKLPFPAAYADEDASGLKVTIKPGENTLEAFKLVARRSEVAGGSPRGGLRD